MSNQIELIERAIEMAVEDLIHGTESILYTLGERPFLTEPKSDEDKVLEYIQLRTEPYSMWYRAEDIRKELEERLAGIDEQEREFRGVSEDNVRKLSYDMTLAYCAEMVKLAKKLNIPVVGSEELPPPPLVDENLGGEEWPERMSGITSSMGSTPDMAMPTIPMAAEPLSMPPPSSPITSPSVPPLL